MPPPPIVIWTARLCVGCYLLRYLADVAGRPKLARRFWIAGWLLLAAHTGAAFHLVHHWSHAAAVVHTAERTRDVLGWSWGGGVWFNYLALAVWGADVVLPVRNARSGRARTTWAVCVHAYLAAMVLSATVVFGPAYWWAVAALFGSALLVLWQRRGIRPPL